MEWFLEALRKYAEFEGRARRKEYWYFILFYMIISIILAVVDAVTGTYSREAGMGLLGGIFALAMFIPSLAVSVRRLHDTDRSGWWLLIGFIPLIGFIVLLVFMLQKSNPGPNQYGAVPKEEPD